MFFLPAKFVLLAVVAAEVVATFLVAEQVGVLGTLLWFVASFVVGVVVVKRAGARAWTALRGASGTPAAAASDTPLLLLAGLLIAVPGVLSDLAGLVLLTPPGRGLVKAWLARKVGKHVTVVRAGVDRVRGSQGPVRGSQSVQAGELVEDDGPDERPDRPRPSA